MFNHKKNMFSTKIYLITMLLIAFFLGIISSSNAMIKDISLDELVRRSDTIAVVDVLAVKAVETLPSGARVIANLVSINQPLMGNVAIGNRLKIKTRGIEDNAKLKKGMKTLLFLKKVDNYYEIVAGIAGSWPVTEEGKIVGYGTGKTISEVEKAIEKIKAEKESTPTSPNQKSSDSIVISI